MSPYQPTFSEEDKPFLFKLPNGATVCCNRTDMINFQEAMEGFSKAFEPHLKKDMWVIDIGSACGDSSVMMGGFLGDFPNSRIIVFEPSREIYPSLMSNLSKNPIIRYDVHTVAAGDCNQMVDFVYGFGNGGLIIPSLIPERGPCIPQYQVQVVNTYQYLRSNYSLEDLDKVGFIKIDTEGYDYVVLRGLAPLIYRNRMPIMVEWWNDPSNSNRMFDVIDSLYYEAFNSFGERVSRFDFSTAKRTQDLIIKPI